MPHRSGRQQNQLDVIFPALLDVTDGMRIALPRDGEYLRNTLLSSLTMLMTLAGSSAFAQTENRFAIGAEFKIRMTDRAANEDYARGRLGPGLLWRFGTSKPGWGFHWGLNWYVVDIERPVGGSAIQLGEVHIRPFMAGWGYTHVVRRTAITADVLAGYAIGSIGLESSAVDAYQRRLGAQAVTASASNTVVLKPEIGVWYDFSKKVGINLNFGYILARPDITVSSTLGQEQRQARADQFILKVGLVYSIF